MENLIVLTWQENDGMELTGRTVMRDGYSRPEFRIVPKARAVVWSRTVNDDELRKAQSYAIANGYTVRTLPDSPTALFQARCLENPREAQAVAI
jgi:hypothetical protein